MKNHPKSLLIILQLLLLFFFFPSHSVVQNGNTQLQQPNPYWLKIKALFNHAQCYLFPPNLDFRGSISNDEPIIGGGGSKVKEAVAKSLGKGTAAVEESAKSAAQKLKQTLPSHQTQEL